MTERGTLLGGRYELDQVIGRGGMAEVWRARDTRLQRDVAVKRLRLDLASDPTFQARFRREAQASAGLNHPNIVAVYDTGEEKDPNSDVMVPFIVMELIEGVTLREVLRGGRKIVPEKALEFTAGVLDALAYSHRAGIIHRDIKPANVMFTPPGTVKVMDFGIARAVADTSATMTQTAAVIGTAQYLSPEQARGEKVDNRSDLYAVGCLLYELLVSEPPFKGDSPVSVAYQHVRETPVRPSERDPEITSDMDAIVMKALAKDPRDRYQDATEFRDDILRALDNKPVHAGLPPVGDAPTQVIATDPITTTARRAAIPAAVGGAAGAIAASPITAGAGNTPEVVADEPVEERRNRGAIITISVLGGLLLIGLIVALFLLFNDNSAEPGPSPSPTPSVASESPSPSPSESPSPEMEAVPSVTGMGQALAESTLRNAGFVPVLGGPTEGTAENNGQVAGTDPEAGTQAERGSEVTISLYEYEAPAEPATATVPENLRGMTEQEARDELVAAGFDNNNISVTNANPATEPIDLAAGQVVEATPTGEIPVTSTITLVLATGQSTVPGLEGMTEDKARETAQDAGFEVEVETVVTDAQPAGVVFEQNPKENTTMSRETPITIRIAEAPAEEPTPTESATP
ncbi:Stk1 family PASTA domain-containing Ser/Thr kinase [Tessaracoccus oleiagri]|uniref:non-specific serine/threonine protein kinase n=1 Tax=Tessaracoccus oleiagri TaxID=686624 RepID=A0A1G9H6Z3_9ACTN|nr:Stk1 family PASTA domain-containing Ser/Thr kinase [Tessaracoccus oleiagri]SDL08697.1 serine/threonine protein kinase [Tessaracoccus oleiagri]